MPGKNIKLPKPNIYIFISVLLLILFSVFKISDKEKCTGLDCLSFKDITNYTRDEIYESDENFFRGLYKSNSDKIRVNVTKGIAEENASGENEILITKMNKLFEKERSPYPGEISDEVSCPDEFIPKWNVKNTDGLKINYASSYLNDRLVYGACTEDQLKYKTLFLTFYCTGQKNLYQIEFIDDKETFDRDYYVSLLETIECKK